MTEPTGPGRGGATLAVSPSVGVRNGGSSWLGWTAAASLDPVRDERRNIVRGKNSLNVDGLSLGSFCGRIGNVLPRPERGQELCQGGEELARENGTGHGSV